METLVSRALMIRLSLQPSPASDTSAFNNIRALSSRWAGLFPFRISASSRSRSSPLSRTTYFFTEISFAAMIASVACVATKANHQILSIWLKRPTSRRQTGRRMRLFTKTAEALLHALAQPLERDVEHRYHEYPDRACGKHAAEHSGTHSPAADLCSAGRDHQRQQAENEGDGSNHQ